METGLRFVLNKIKYFFIPYLIMLIICVAVKIEYDRETVYHTVNAIHNHIADYLAPYITDIGDGLTVVVLSAILVLFNYRRAFLLFSSFLLTAIVAQALKYCINMPRPGTYFNGRMEGIYLVKGVYIIGGIQSFPSGHTVTAFSAAVTITYLLKNKFWGMALLIVAILVGYSRMYLSEHFFEDVTAGSAIGTFVTVLWLGYIDSKDFLRSPRWNRGILKK
ncbi:hypothetical protein A0256_24145 [Mucilaginibacter sp. PAMC 26640]|nr:hypothetical protein A0256_24145 [Mucilaginibacter sp. PAMC 26640]